MMGGDGLTNATKMAILNANYIKESLKETFHLPYDRPCMHECVFTDKHQQEHHVATLDIAKRLMDYGFHAPTMSFPVAGTLMIEPTESEDLGELERFIAAMIAIREEANQVAEGVWPADDNPLVNAPHTAAAVTATQWDHPYSRELACYPADQLTRGDAEGSRGGAPAVVGKYWPPVRRVDQAFGDRNLVCACPPIEAFA